jgi:hypothetical protein
MTAEVKARSPELEAWWQKLGCRFAQADNVFDECMEEASARLSAEGLESFIENARFIGKMGRGAEPLLIYLETAPQAASQVGEEVLGDLKDMAYYMSTHTNFKAIVPFLQTCGAVSECLPSYALFKRYIDMVREMMDRTTGSVHGHHTTFASPGLPELLMKAPSILTLVPLGGMKNWIEYGIRYYNDHPERQIEYFSLESADSKAVLQRERHGTLFIDNERKLDLYLRGLWQDPEQLVPYSRVFDGLTKPMPYYDEDGIRLPDVYDDTAEISGIDCYRAALAHMAAHRRWSSKMVVDNWSPFQRLGVEVFEDCRVDHLSMQRYPGLKRLFLALHPIPDEGLLNSAEASTIRIKLAMVSRAMLDPEYVYENADIREFAGRFHEAMAAGESNSPEMANLGLLFIARMRRQSDLSPNVYFQDTEVEYRDDNRHLWIYLEKGDDEDTLFDHLDFKKKEDAELQSLPPRHYDEWDYTNKNYRPDWVSVYEMKHPGGSPAKVDGLLEKHAGLAKRMKRILDMIKPQDKVRIRYQEEGSELDLDVAIRSLIDYKAGSQPDPRINMSHKTDGRNIAVSLVLDLSESLGEKVPGTGQTILELSQEAVSLLAWSVEHLGDPFAISGFHSNTRHDVRYYHIKGYNEGWDDSVKGRIGAMQAAWSTRMGAAMRHAGHYLKAQPADKKLMLVLTDGEPADIDTKDPQMLIQDARMAVNELDRDGIFCYCINLDPKADEYVSDIFGKQYMIVDKIEQLPVKLPELFIALTK